MRAIRLNAQGPTPSDNVELVSDWPEAPEPGAGEVAVCTLASAFNHMDLWVGRGVPGLPLEYPRVSGCDACGEVESVGPGVDPGWVGRRVLVNAAVAIERSPRPGDPPGSTLAPEYELIGEHTHGMHRERFLAPAANLAPAPGGVEPTQAAGFGLCFLTAYSMLIGKARLRPGQNVLITGIGGGVATSALAIAKHLGCPAAVTSRSASKLERARGLGADEAVLDAGEDWSRTVRAWTRQRGVDVAIDSVGRATHLSCVKSLARGGAYVTPGCTTGPDATTDLARIFWNQLRLLGSTMGTNDEFREVAALYAAGAVRPVIDSVFEPEACADAYRRLESQEQFGKVVIDWR